ncbi:MAG: HD domain-containing protein [Syntrophomonadaceae bacterium]
MIRKELLEYLYQAASIKRWNDHITPPNGFSELDKQAHKVVFAYVIGKMEEDVHQKPINWRELIEGAIFEFIHRVKLTDIKPPIFHKLMIIKGPELNNWVFTQVEGMLDGIGPDQYLSKRFISYFSDPKPSLEKSILRASHYLATNWEFEIIYNFNSTLYGLEETKRNIIDEIEEHYHLAGVQKISLRKKTHSFLDMVGQLRFQKRWSQTPRIPETSVLGHMLIVAILSYLFSIELHTCDKRLYNNFFGGLFHDLPEVLTRDIISPIKSSIEGLDDIIKSIEMTQVEERLFPLLPQAWHAELDYFIKDEFASKIIIDGKPVHIRSDEINNKYNEDKYNPLDGEIIKACDKLAAYLEAALSINYGIKTTQLSDGFKALYNANKHQKVAGINFGMLFDYFWSNV